MKRSPERRRCRSGFGQSECRFPIGQRFRHSVDRPTASRATERLSPANTQGEREIWGSPHLDPICQIRKEPSIGLRAGINR